MITADEPSPPNASADNVPLHTNFAFRDWVRTPRHVDSFRPLLGRFLPRSPEWARATQYLRQAERCVRSAEWGAAEWELCRFLEVVRESGGPSLRDNPGRAP